MLEWSVENVVWLFGLFLVAVVLLLFTYGLRSYLLHRRRRRSVRRSDDGDYMWIGLDGRPRSSRDDPRPDWDASNASGGSDGGWGDGGGIGGGE